MRANGKKRQLGPRSVREVRAELAEVYVLLHAMKESGDLADKLTAIR